MANPSGRAPIHGHRRGRVKSPTYKTWLGMKRRCTDAGQKDFRHYGGRGVCVCERWAKSFSNFLADMGERPSLDHDIDRLHVNGHYEPGNCRWVLHAVNSQENKRNIRGIVIDGISFHSIAAACRHFGISTTTVNMREVSGWALEKAIMTPIGATRGNRQRLTYLRKDHPDRL